MNKLQNNDSYEQRVEDGAKAGEIVGAEEARRQLDAYQPPPMDAGLAAALDEFVSRKRHLYGESKP